MRLSQVARLRQGHALIVGAATYNGDEGMLGTVLMLTGANSREVAHEAAEALSKIPLPPGLGAALVIAILVLFLGNIRAAVLVAVAIPFSMLVPRAIPSMKSDVASRRIEWSTGAGGQVPGGQFATLCEVRSETHEKHHSEGTNIKGLHLDSHILTWTESWYSELA